jgi:hypothetical protein
MVEVFKTNVKHHDQAIMLTDQIRKTFPGYDAGFDLDDCDKVLRVICTSGSVRSSCLIDLLRSFGFNAEVLEDEVLPPGFKFDYKNQPAPFTND